MKTTFIMNGITYIEESDMTILEVAIKNGIEIPNLCYDKNIKTHGNCEMCMVEDKSSGELIKSCATLIKDNMNILTETEKISKFRKIKLEEKLVNHGGDCRPPCMLACPAETDCQGYVGLIAKGEYENALELIMDKIPMPGSIGRVCPHPCEDKCRRGQKDEPVSILWLKRFAADQAMKSGNIKPSISSLDWASSPISAAYTGLDIAIIGGGPMGISAAYFLARKGYHVTIYEEMPKLGGMLRYGIPEYRLPNEIIDQEIEMIETLGVKIITDTKIGIDIPFEKITKDYNAVLIGIGAWVSTGIGCKGEDGNGVLGGIQFLERVAKKEQVHIGKRVAIVGGGNTAMDACRTAVRLGATEVYNIYRRTKGEMPADEVEIIEAEEEGVIFKNLRNPIEVVHGKIDESLKIVLQVMALGEPDESGRRSPFALEGQTEEIEIDTLILAVGQAVEQLEMGGITRTKKGGIAYDKNTYMTSLPGVFAGGDCGNDKISIAVEAVADARKAADCIDMYLQGKEIKIEKPTLVHFNSLTLDTFEDREWLCRPKMGQLSPEERKNNFKEIIFGHTEEEAKKEAARCLECGCHDYYECKLIDYAHKFEVSRESLHGPEEVLPIDDSHDFIRRDPNKCIQCGMCVRVCQERMQIGAQGEMPEDNVDAKPSYNQPLDLKGCVGCGMCVSVCPTGAMEGKGKYASAYWETEKTKTTCTYCGVGCQMNLITKWGKVIGVEPADGIANEGMLCVKGRFAYDFINHKSRLTTPMIRKNGELEPATWNEALSLIADQIIDIKEKFGPDAIMGFSSAKVTNENNYLFQKFIRAAIGTNNVDHCARLCHSSTVSGLANTLGSGAMTNPIADIKKADLIFITGSNTTETHPVMGAFIRQAVAGGTKLIVADPKRIPLAEDADLYLQMKPGTSVALTNGMLHVILKEGLEDKEYIKEHTVGIEELTATVEKYTPDYTAEICGLNPEEIVEAARMYAKAGSAYIAYAMGITQHINGTQNVISMSNLALATGNIGKSGAGVNPLRGQNNVQGACDMGALPTDYPGYQKVTEERVQEKFQDAWNVNLSKKAGLTVTTVPDEILQGKVKLLYIMGENPVVSDPNTHHIKKALDKAFVVVQDIFLTETTEFADVVLPSTCFAETEGTFTNTERRVQRVRKAVEPKGEAREDWQILAGIMNRIGYNCSYTSAKDIYDEMRNVTPSYKGISFERIENEGLCWPCPDNDHPGTPILHKNGPAIGKGVLVGVEHNPSPETILKGYPIILMTGRVLEHYHTRTMTKLTHQIDEKYPENYIEISLVDADELGIKNGDKVRVSSLRGEIQTTAYLSTGLRAGNAFMPFHFGEGANVLTDAEALDPTSKIPGFKQTGIKVSLI
jgi:formate dehydrogenase major subunit